MKTVLLAYHEMGCIGLEALIRNNCEVLAVFTHRDDPDENTWFNSVAETAAQYDIPVYAPEDINHPVWVEKIRKLAPDIIFSFYYRKLLKKPILDIPPLGCINLHGSLLPRYRGRCPVNWALVHGETETGVTLHQMTIRPDEGNIIAQKKVAIEDTDTALTLFHRMTAAADQLLDEVLPDLRGGKIEGTPQNQELASYFGGRKPADGRIDWTRSAHEIRNLVRAVTRPYPGAFTYQGDRKCLIWKATEVPNTATDAFPGTILKTRPLTVACGKGALVIDSAQVENGVFQSGTQLAAEMNLTEYSRFGQNVSALRAATRKKRVLILGVDGFIGNALTERLLEDGGYEVIGMDLRSDSLERFRDNQDFSFYEGDISIHQEWLEFQIKKCDIVLPLVAIATPIEYTRNPLRVFELDFEENLKIIRYCVKYGKRVLFPSTSEVYGMCSEDVFDEDHSRLVLGPINKQRWIYSCSKQLLDRVIWAYGAMEGLKFTLFRPFNWIGPRLDSLDSARIGSSRVITQLILNLVEGSPIQLIDGGEQKRCFTDVLDGVECLFRLIENEGSRCDGQIVNIGNPDNELSIRQLAEILVEQFESHPERHRFPPFAGYQVKESAVHYGKGYEDLQHRRPSIRNARKLVAWEPKIPIEASISRTLSFFLEQAIAELRGKEDGETPIDFDSATTTMAALRLASVFRR